MKTAFVLTLAIIVVGFFVGLWFLPPKHDPYRPIMLPNYVFDQEAK